MADNIQLLKLTVKKWHGVAFEGAHERGAEDCSLCETYRKAQFIPGAYWTCGDCPIRAKTERDGCRGTPYDDWLIHLKEEHRALNEGRQVLCPICKQLAVAELLFLEDLLKEEEKKMGMGDRPETKAEREAEEKGAWLEEQSYALARDFMEQEHVQEHLATNIAHEELMANEFERYTDEIWENRKNTE